MNFKFDGENSLNSQYRGKFFYRKIHHPPIIGNQWRSREAEVFETEQTKVNVTAGGLAYVYATKLLRPK